MAKRRGFFAELQHQNQLAQRRQQQQASANLRVLTAAMRHAEQAQRNADRAAAQFARATAAQQKELEREAKRLHEEAMHADVAQRNAELADQILQIDGLLAATLEIDDFVDLNKLRRIVEHPPFAHSGLELPLPPLPPLSPPPEPVFVKPSGEPKGLGGAFGGKKKYADLLAQAEAEFALIHQAWQAEVDQVPNRQRLQDLEYQRATEERSAELARARAEYEAECHAREQDVQAANARLDTLIANLGYDVEDAIQEYVAIVLGNSVYPECFPVEHDFEFNSALRELTLTVLVPGPSEMPSVKEYKYVRAKDEITSTPLPAKERKDRYANALSQVALRTMHEVFEADRAGRVRTISLTVATEHTDAATGRMNRTPLVAVAADRETFTSFELANVVPSATLQHMGALISKNPFDLVAVDTSKGVRGR